MVLSIRCIFTREATSVKLRESQKIEIICLVFYYIDCKTKQAIINYFDDSLK